MATKLKVKLKPKRAFLEHTSNSDSYYVLDISDRNYVTLKLADCEKTINWSFGKPKEERAMKKIAVLKKLVDEMYNYLHQEEV